MGNIFTKNEYNREKHPPWLDEIKEIAEKLEKQYVSGHVNLERFFMKVIGVVGLPASGKGEFSKIAAEWEPVIVMGDMIRNAVKRKGLSPPMRISER